MPSKQIHKTSMEELNRISPTEFKQADKIPVTILLDNIRSLQNVGSFFRTSDAFRVQSIYLCGITGTPPNKEIEKTALGATESVNYNYFENTVDAVSQLKQSGTKIVAIEQAKESVYLDEFFPQPDSSYAFIFGNEVFGVAQDVIELADIILEIPQFGTKHSFNVSVSAGIVLWDYYLKNSLNLRSKPL